MARRHGHSDEQILHALRRAESGQQVVEVRRQLGEEHLKRKRLVADLTIDRHLLPEIVRKKLRGLGSDVSWLAGPTWSQRSVNVGRRG